MTQNQTFDVIKELNSIILRQGYRNSKRLSSQQLKKLFIQVLKKRYQSLKKNFSQQQEAFILSFLTQTFNYLQSLIKIHAPKIPIKNIQHQVRQLLFNLNQNNEFFLFMNEGNERQLWKQTQKMNIKKIAEMLFFTNEKQQIKQYEQNLEKVTDEVKEQMDIFYNRSQAKQAKIYSMVQDFDSQGKKSLEQYYILLRQLIDQQYKYQEGTELPSIQQKKKWIQKRKQMLQILKMKLRYIKKDQKIRFLIKEAQDLLARQQKDIRQDLNQTDLYDIDYLYNFLTDPQQKNLALIIPQQSVFTKEIVKQLQQIRAQTIKQSKNTKKIQRNNQRVFQILSKLSIPKQFQKIKSLKKGRISKQKQKRKAIRQAIVTNSKEQIKKQLKKIMKKQIPRRKIKYQNQLKKKQNQRDIIKQELQLKNSEIPDINKEIVQLSVQNSRKKNTKHQWHQKSFSKARQGQKQMIEKRLNQMRNKLMKKQSQKVIIERKMKRIQQNLQNLRNIGKQTNWNQQALDMILNQQISLSHFKKNQELSLREIQLLAENQQIEDTYIPTYQQLKIILNQFLGGQQQLENQEWQRKITPILQKSQKYKRIWLPIFLSEDYIHFNHWIGSIIDLQKQDWKIIDSSDRSQNKQKDTVQVQRNRKKIIQQSKLGQLLIRRMNLNIKYNILPKKLIQKQNQSGIYASMVTLNYQKYKNSIQRGSSLRKQALNKFLNIIKKKQEQRLDELALLINQEQFNIIKQQNIQEPLIQDVIDIGIDRRIDQIQNKIIDIQQNQQLIQKNEQILQNRKEWMKQKQKQRMKNRNLRRIQQNQLQNKNQKQGTTRKLVKRTNQIAQYIIQKKKQQQPNRNLQPKLLVNKYSNLVFQKQQKKQILQKLDQKIGRGNFFSRQKERQQKSPKKRIERPFKKLNEYQQLMKKLYQEITKNKYIKGYIPNAVKNLIQYRNLQQLKFQSLFFIFQRILSKKISIWNRILKSYKKDKQKNQIYADIYTKTQRQIRDDLQNLMKSLVQVQVDKQFLKIIEKISNIYKQVKEQRQRQNMQQQWNNYRLKIQTKMLLKPQIYKQKASKIQNKGQDYYKSYKKVQEQGINLLNDIIQSQRIQNQPPKEQSASQQLIIKPDMSQAQLILLRETINAKIRRKQNKNTIKQAIQVNLKKPQPLKPSMKYQRLTTLAQQMYNYNFLLQILAANQMGYQQQWQRSNQQIGLIWDKLKQLRDKQQKLLQERRQIQKRIQQQQREKLFKIQKHKKKKRQQTKELKKLLFILKNIKNKKNRNRKNLKSSMLISTALAKKRFEKQYGRIKNQQEYLGLFTQQLLKILGQKLNSQQLSNIKNIWSSWLLSIATLKQLQQQQYQDEQQWKLQKHLASNIQQQSYLKIFKFFSKKKDKINNNLLFNILNHKERIRNFFKTSRPSPLLRLPIKKTDPKKIFKLSNMQQRNLSQLIHNGVMLLSDQITISKDPQGQYYTIQQSQNQKITKLKEYAYQVIQQQRNLIQGLLNTIKEWNTQIDKKLLESKQAMLQYVNFQFFIQSNSFGEGRKIKIVFKIPIDNLTQQEILFNLKDRLVRTIDNKQQYQNILQWFITKIRIYSTLNPQVFLKDLPISDIQRKTILKNIRIFSQNVWMKYQCQLFWCWKRNRQNNDCLGYVIQYLCSNIWCRQIPQNKISNLNQLQVFLNNMNRTAGIKVGLVQYVNKNIKKRIDFNYCVCVQKIQGQLHCYIINNFNKVSMLINTPKKLILKNQLSYFKQKQQDFLNYFKKRQIFLDIQCLSVQYTAQKIISICVAWFQDQQQFYRNCWALPQDVTQSNYQDRKSRLMQSFCNFIYRLLQSSDNSKQWTIWAYNGINYDYQYLLVPLVTYGFDLKVLGSISQPKGYSLQKWGKRLKILQARNIITSGSLKDNTKKYCKIYKKSQFQMKKILTLKDYVINKKQLIQYNMMDCLSMGQLIWTTYLQIWNYVKLQAFKTKRQKRINLIQICSKWTIPSIAYYTFNRIFLNQQLLYPDCQQLIKIHRKNYFGGCTQVFKHIANQQLYQLDVNSQYPFVMYNQQMPCWLVYQESQIFQQQMLEGIKNGQYNNYLFKIKSFQLSQITPCTIGINRKAKMFYPKSFISLQNQQRWLWGIQMKIPLSLNSSFEIQKYYAYSNKNTYRNTRQGQKKQWDCMKRYVQQAYNYRLLAKQKGDNLMDNIGKLFMNSLYGKFAQKQFVSSYITRYCQDQQLIIANKRENVVYIKDTNQKKEGFILGNYIRLSSFITAAARSRLTQLISKGGVQNIWYCDTDSLYVNEEGYQRLQEAHQINNKILGKLKVQHFLQKGFFIGRKAYCTKINWQKQLMFKLIDIEKYLKKRDKPWLMKSKGINTNQQCQIIEQLYQKANQYYQLAVQMWNQFRTCGKILTIMKFNTKQWNKDKKQQGSITINVLGKKMNFLFMRKPTISGQTIPFQDQQILTINTKQFRAQNQWVMSLNQDLQQLFRKNWILFENS